MFVNVPPVQIPAILGELQDRLDFQLGSSERRGKIGHQRMGQIDYPGKTDGLTQRSSICTTCGGTGRSVGWPHASCNFCNDVW